MTNLENSILYLPTIQVSIPPGGATDAFVETVITWDMNGKNSKQKS